MTLTCWPGRWPALVATIPLAASLVLAQGGPAAPAAPVKIGAPVGAIRFQDLAGRAYTPGDLRGHPATLFLFLSTECPISNSYTTRLQALDRKYASRGVLIFGVNSNRDESVTAVVQHARQYGYPFPMVKDQDSTLARRLGATMTPEAVLLDRAGVIRYRGRIDDQRDASLVKSHDLQNALQSVLAGSPVARAEVPSFGCAIVLQEPTAVAHATITYTRDIAPLLQAECQDCHRPGEIGPFSLLSYDEACRFSSLIKDYTARRIMPPWKPVQGYGQFANEKRLTDTQIQTIAAWVKEGCPRGDPRDMPPPRKFTEGWRLGTPDVVLDAGEPYQVSADGRDVYRNFVLSYVPDHDLWVKAVEVRPDQRAVVHHVIVYGDPEGKSVALAAAKDGTGPGYTSSGGGPGFFPADFLGGWAPGNTPQFAPRGVAMKIAANSHLVLQVHYHKNGRPQLDRTRVGLYFAREPIEKQARVIPILNRWLAIPPGEAQYKASADATIPTDVTVYGVMPHMHLLGRQIKVTATLPNGTAKPLVWIKDWDFNWQEGYGFKQPLHLPRGTKVAVDAVYDNTAKNPNNPNHPPQPVHWGEQTTDEMLLAFLVATVDSEHLKVNPVTSTQAQGPVHQAVKTD